MRKLIFNEDEFKRLYVDEMLSHRELAKHFDCDKSTISNHAKAVGLSRDRTALTYANRRQFNIDNRQNYKGDDWPRAPRRFKFMFPTDRCGWIRCPNPIAPFGQRNGSVDHNHGCTRHQTVNNDTVYYACRHCVRAYVHQGCNVMIEHWEWAQSQGLGPIPDDVKAYISIGNLVVMWMG